MASKTKIFSISGQIETAAAETMIERHGLFKIMPSLFPPTVARFDEEGRPVAFAIAMNETQEHEFDRIVAQLRA